MTHPEIVDLSGQRRLKCPASGCQEALRPNRSMKINGYAEIRFFWRCGRCGKTTELVIDISDGCWLFDGELLTTIPPEYSGPPGP